MSVMSSDSEEQNVRATTTWAQKRDGMFLSAETRGEESRSKTDERRWSERKNLETRPPLGEVIGLSWSSERNQWADASSVTRLA